MKLQIPHPEDKLDISLLERYDEISEVYLKGPTGQIGSGRIHAYDPTVSELKRLSKELHDIGVNINIVLNATCLHGRQFSVSWIRKTLNIFDVFTSLDIDALTIADPYLINLVKNYGYPFKIVVSCLAFVDSPLKAKYFDEMGVDRITLPPDINRCFNLIREIRNAVNCELGVIVNEGCLPNCPYRLFCFNWQSHISVERFNEIKLVRYDKKTGRMFLEDTDELPQYYQVSHGTRRRTNPYLFLVSPWIRPENIKDYEESGIQVFKISGRSQPSCFLARCLEAYHSRSYEGNLFDLIDNHPRIPVSKDNLLYGPLGEPLYYVNNKELDEFFDKVKTCSKNCATCDYCKEFAEKHLTINKRIPKQRIPQIPIYPWPLFIEPIR